MQEWIKLVARGKKRAKDLSYEEAYQAALSLVHGKATDAQIAALLIAERLKEESPEEMAAFAKVFQAATTKIPLPASTREKLIDFGGPYTGRNTFAATIPVALLMAAEGIPIYLHSDDPLPPKYATSIKSIVQGLGINVNANADTVAHTIESHQIGFGNMSLLCPPLGRLRPIREQLGVRTFFNTIEKVISPAGASSIIVGIFHRTVVETNAKLLRKLGYQNMYMVQGMEGSEDLPIHRLSFLYHVTQNSTTSFDIHPGDEGIEAKRNVAIEKLNLNQQVSLIEELLQGNGPNGVHDIVTYNAGVRYYLFGHTTSIKEGISLANDQLKSQIGWKHLLTWREKSYETYSVDRARQSR